MRKSILLVFLVLGLLSGCCVTDREQCLQDRAIKKLMKNKDEISFTLEETQPSGNWDGAKLKIKRDRQGPFPLDFHVKEHGVGGNDHPFTPDEDKKFIIKQRLTSIIIEYPFLVEKTSQTQIKEHLMILTIPKYIIPRRIRVGQYKICHHQENPPCGIHPHDHSLSTTLLGHDAANGNAREVDS